MANDLPDWSSAVTSQVYLGLVGSGAAGVAQTTTINLPAGSQALVLDYDGNSPGDWAHIRVKGHTSNLVYFESYHFPGLVGQILAVFPVLYARDAQLDVLLDSTNFGAPESISITALQNSAPEFLEYYKPPWAFPNKPPIDINFALANGGNIMFINSIANTTLYLHRIHLEANFPAGATSPNLNFTDDLLNFICHMGALTVAGAWSADLDFEGAPMAIGRGLVIGNVSGVATRVVGVATYSRA